MEVQTVVEEPKVPGVEGSTAEAPVTPNWEQEAKGYQEFIGSLGYKDKDSLKTDWERSQGVINDTYLFLKHHPEIKEKYESFFGNGGTAEKPKPTQPERADAPLDQKALREELRREMRAELESEISPLKAQADELREEREKIATQSKYPWFTDESYAELDKRYKTKMQYGIRRFMGEGDDFKTAQRRAGAKYSDATLEEMIHLLMPEKLIENASAARRVPVPLPKSMTRVGGNGEATPSEIEQAKKEYEAAEKGEESAHVVKKYKEKFGLENMDEALKILRGE